jgi:invasion protein IalB
MVQSSVNIRSAGGGSLAAGVAILVALSLAPIAQPASAAEQIVKTFGSWTVRCVERDKAPKTCSMIQSSVQVNKQNKRRRLLLRWAISTTQKGEQTQRLIVPTGVSIKEGVRLFIGEGEPTVIPYNVCGPRVCIAEAPVDAKAISAIKASKKVSASYVRGSKQLAQVTLNPDGFAEAYNFLSQQLS